MFGKTLMSGFAALIVSGAVAIAPAYAGDGGGGDDFGPSPYATLHNPDGSTVTANRDSNGNTVNIRRNAGKEERTLRPRPSRPSATATNPDGSTITSEKLLNGDRIVTTRDADGRVTNRRIERANQGSWAASSNPETGERAISGRTANGARYTIHVGPRP